MLAWFMRKSHKCDSRFAEQRILEFILSPYIPKLIAFNVAFVDMVVTEKENLLLI